MWRFWKIADEDIGDVEQRVGGEAGDDAGGFLLGKGQRVFRGDGGEFAVEVRDALGRDGGSRRPMRGERRRAGGFGGGRSGGFPDRGSGAAR